MKCVIAIVIRYFEWIFGAFAKIWLSHELKKIPSWLQCLRGTKID
jgi:hypothetical protein